ncbi:uncharacterized protein LOC107161152 [Zea mays]|uniref:LOB domain-containing protein n=1 Tax=Zea mays TaxID=4577 RepID=A0A1D6F9Z0_MAIZE|nr:uncharacterized protein LOC107161152 [Zea mays]ONM27924.1 hypothetical protein ZEAMMB73_Zm00001d007919 [Zea mays]|eukprot:NP_001306148.1 uncharacterized protein LOC107161152 [Zea mays]
MPADGGAVAGAPCGACRTLRCRCVPRCVFAAYFSAEEFAAVHGVFGASNVSKMPEDIGLPEQRRLAVDTLVEEARAWARDPTFDRVSYLCILQDQEVNDKYREQVDDAREEFDAEVASEPVDVAAAGLEAQAQAQVDAALQHEQDYRLLGGWGATTGEQQHLVTQDAENEHGIILGHGHPAELSQEILQLQELLDMAELSRNRKQQIIQKTEMGQYWDAAAGGAREHDLLTMMQQAPAAAWQHQYPAPQYAGIRGGPGGHQEMPQPMEEACTAEFATGMGIMSQQFASAQPYHDHDPAAVPHASPWLQRMPEAQQPAAASQVASEQDMLLLLLLQQHQVAAAGLMSAGGARQLDNVAAQYDDTEVALGYGYGHPDMHQHQHQQVAAAGQVAGVDDDMNPREMTQQQHAQQGLDIALGNGHLDGETEAMLQELAALLEQAGKQETIRKQQGVATGMGQWDAVTGIAWEQDVTTMTHQQSPDAAAWLQVQEMLEQMEEASSTPEFAEIIAWQAEARYAQEELAITLGNDHPDWSTQDILQAQELFAMAELARKQEMVRNLVAAAALAREQEMIAQQQQHPEAQYSGTELDISLWQGPGHGHPYWHQPTMQQMLQEKQLPTVQQLLQEQQLADAIGFGTHQASTTLVPQYANGEHGSGTGAAMAFQSPGSDKDAPFPFPFPLYVGL